MTQARGAASRLLFQKEVTFRTAPAAAAKVLPFTTWGLNRTPNRQDNPTINASPLPAKGDEGDPSITGAFGSIFDLRSIGNWFYLLLGAPTVYKAVTSQPVNVTGVTVHYAGADCTSGNGTLTWVLSGTTLAWTCASGTIGAAQDVSAGGDFSLASGGGGKLLNITVVPASLPAGNTNDATIAVSATLKAHHFPVNNTIRPSALTELQHSDVSLYFRTLGVKCNKLSWDPLANDQNLSGELIAAYEVDPIPTSAFDGAPTEYTAVRACSGKGKLWDGNGTTLGDIAGGTVQADNQMSAISYLDGLVGAGTIDQGDLLLSGSMRAVFDGATAWALAKANTSTRMRIESAALSGADTFKLALDLPNVELMEAAPAREGKSGLYVPINWKAHRGTTLPKVVLVNDVTAY